MLDIFFGKKPLCYIFRLVWKKEEKGRKTGWVREVRGDLDTRERIRDGVATIDQGRVWGLWENRFRTTRSLGSPRHLFETYFFKGFFSPSALR